MNSHEHEVAWLRAERVRLLAEVARLTRALEAGRSDAERLRELREHWPEQMQKIEQANDGVYV